MDEQLLKYLDIRKATLSAYEGAGYGKLTNLWNEVRKDGFEVSLRHLTDILSKRYNIKCSADKSIIIK